MSRKKKQKNNNKKSLKPLIHDLFKKAPHKIYSKKEIFQALEISDAQIKTLTTTILKELENDDFIIEKEKNNFVLNDSFKTSFEGTVDATQRGAAYIIIPELDKDIYIRPENIHNALDGDTVEVELVKHKKSKLEGKVTKIIKRKTTMFIGTLEVHQKFAFLIIDNVKINIDLYIPLDKLNNARTNQKAIGRMTSWPKGVDNPFGEIVEVLGDAENNDTEMYSILLKNNFEIKFPKGVLKEANEVGTELSEEVIQQRKDFRNKFTLTIDPADAKDFDDALSFEVLENGNFEIGVHIADVSHYVQPNSMLDKEALKRGNSVYLEDRVIPMLPEQLSNIACSLRPDEDKLTFSAVFEMDGEGKIHKEWFGKSVIRSNKRLAYEDAQEIIENKGGGELAQPILTLDKIAKTLRAKRIQKGALSIESEEIKFKLDEEGNPIGIVKKVQQDAHKLIEEFMLLANKRVAIFVGKLPDSKGSSSEFIYRCHDKPELEKLNTFSVFIDKFGYKVDFENINNVAKKLNALLEQVRDTPEYGLIQSMAIRSMSKAEYRTSNIGHYGLAFDYYTHFTSPIRRYADLMVHRILFNKIEKHQKSYGNKLNEICKHISAQERKAIDAERESNKFFQAKYLQDKIGDSFLGTVSGLADFGMFVKMDDNYCEGMVSIQNIPGDTYYFDLEKFQIIGKQTRAKYNFGDKVQVKIKKVDLRKKQVDLELL